VIVVMGRDPTLCAHKARQQGDTEL